MAAEDFDIDGEDWFGSSEAEPATTAETAVQVAAPKSVAVNRDYKPTRTELSALFFDIETVPDESRLESFGLPELPETKPESGVEQCPEVETLLKGNLDAIERELLGLNPVDSYLDLLMAAERSAAKPRSGVEKAVAAVKTARDKVKNAEADRRKLLSVTPEYCRLAALGWASGSGPTESLTCGEHAECDTSNEKTLLEAFWSLAAESRALIGFNVLHFDLRVIFVRSALLGVKPSRLFDLKPWGKDVIDLMLVRFGTASQAMGLKKLAPLYGIEVPAGDCDGSQVAELMSVNPKMVAEYVQSDVAITREFYRRLAGFFCQ